MICGAKTKADAPPIPSFVDNSMKDPMRHFPAAVLGRFQIGSIRMSFVWLVLFGASWGCLSTVQAQTGKTLAELKTEAAAAFEGGDWRQAHRNYAELLSLDGTDRSHQIRYAATLLHDARMRKEGMQRLAGLVEAGQLDAEGWHWWGMAMMRSGNATQAVEAFERALSEAGKKHPLAEAMALGRAQASSMPTSFDSRQAIHKLESVEVPLSSFHRFVNWEMPQAKLLLLPEELLGKRDKKEGHAIAVAFIRDEPSMFFHSKGAKGESGWDLYEASVSAGGSFGAPKKLPDVVNSPYDEVNPVWDPQTQSLHFATNRPGTMGGMDIWVTRKTSSGWSAPEPSSPLVNSMFNEWAFFPAPDEGKTAWLVTDRDGEFGATEVWQVSMEGLPQPPMVVTSQWDVEGDAIPGTLTLTEAKTGQELAVVDVGHAQGSWDMTLAASTVLHYEFVTVQGEVVKGTYALPSAEGPSALNQRMVMRLVDGKPLLEAKPLTTSSVPDASIAWGWEAALEEVESLTFVPFTEDVDATEEVAEPQAGKGRGIIQLQSYPWWSDIQKEERAIAASLIVKFVPEDVPAAPDLTKAESPAAHRQALEEEAEAWYSYASTVVLAGVAEAILAEEMSWEEAFARALARGMDVWPVGVVDTERVARLCQRSWGELGSLFDQGLLPEIQDKQSLVADKAWLEKPWEEGHMQAMADRVTPHSMDAIAVAWLLARQPAETSDAAHKNPSFWELSAARQAIEQAPKSEMRVALLQEARTRLTFLDALASEGLLEEEEASRLVLAWRSLAVDLAKDQDLPSLVDSDASDAPTEGESNEVAQAMASDVSAWQEVWEAVLQQGDDQPRAAWEEDMWSWLEETSKANPLPHELVAQAMGVEHPAMAQAMGAERPMTPQEMGMHASASAVCEALLALEPESIGADDALETVKAAWVAGRWGTHPDWMRRTPDEIEALVSSWPDAAKEALDKERVLWAEGLQASDQGAQMGFEPRESTALDAIPATTEDLPKPLSTSPEIGRRGMQLGWFRQAPEWPETLPGMSVEEYPNGSGLSKWVLLLPEAGMDGTRLQRWLSEAEVHDAFEVIRAEQGWVRFNGSNERVATNEGQQSLPESAEESGDDEVWLHGAPVLLGELMGTWYAVQVGAFRGDPEKAWIEAADERLVYEPFDDGIARWYAGVRQAQSEARERLRLLKQRAPFADAFLVKLSNGVREVVAPEADSSDNEALVESVSDDAVETRSAVEDESQVVEPLTNQESASNASEAGAANVQDPVEVDVAMLDLVEPSPSEAMADPMAVRDPEGMAWSQGVSPVESLPVTEEQGQKPTGEAITKAMTWHVDIARYYGTVPSADVAVLLFQSADWGVRSWTMRGQTTYYTRSFANLQEAQAVLESVKREGFVNAELVED